MHCVRADKNNMLIKVQAFLLIIGASTTLTDAFSTSAITLAVKFKEGLSSSFEFTEAQRQLYSAQQNYLQSMIDVITKKTALDKITNNK